MMYLLGKWHYWAIAFIILNVILSAWWLIHGDIRYDVDISRDFLLIKEIIDTKRIPLIGSHTSIGGVFHGPLWYYLNLPVFYIWGGSPIFIGWFWFGLSILTLVIFWVVCEKLFNRNTALLATLLYSANSIINPIFGLKMFFPPYGAVVLSPLFFYMFLKYIKTKKPIFLGLSLLLVGFFIQFEMAFGIPILILVTIFLAYFLYTKKLLKHLLVYPIILIPLSTFILFDLRHDLIQTKSLFKYLISQTDKLNFNLIDFLVEKITGIFSDTFFLLTQDNRLLSWVYSLLFILLIFKSKIPKSTKTIYLVFLYFYLGYWIIYLFLKPLWSSYYWPLLPLIIMLYVGFVNFTLRKIFLIIYIPLLVWNMYIGISYIKDSNLEISQRGRNSWAFNKFIAESIFDDAEGEFGYFIFTPERWVYQGWYALDFVQKQFPQKKGYPFIKKDLTYLIIFDSPKVYPDPVSMGWKITDLKINQEPQKRSRIDRVEIQKYYLTEEEKNKPINPYLLNSTFFR